MTVNFAGHLYNDAGSAVNGASVKLLETGTTTQEGSTVTTDSDGAWAFTEADQDRYDVEITSGSSVRRIRWDDQISLKEIIYRLQPRLSNIRHRHSSYRYHAYV